MYGYQPGRHVVDTTCSQLVAFGLDRRVCRFASRDGGSGTLFIGPPRVFKKTKIPFSIVRNFRSVKTRKSNGSLDWPHPNPPWERGVSPPRVFVSRLGHWAACGTTFRLQNRKRFVCGVSCNQHADPFALRNNAVPSRKSVDLPEERYSSC